MGFSHTEVRQCSRCGLKLTDLSSFEKGIGPICSRQNTHLYAKTIPADFGAVNMNLFSVNTENLPLSVVEVFEEVKTCLLKQYDKLLDKSRVGAITLSGEDCRESAKKIDWMLSFDIPPTEKERLILIVHHLGFIGLAAVLSGKASTGEATVEFKPETGFLELTGSRCKAGYLAMSKIPGCILPRGYNARTFQVPAREAEAFMKTAIQYWPCFAGDIQTVVTEAKEWVKAQPAPVVPVVEMTVVAKVDVNTPVATLTKRGSDFTLVFDRWVKGKTENVIASIKQVNYKDRKYDPNTRAWSFKTKHLERVKTALVGVYELNIKE